MNKDIYLSNTLVGKKEIFKPINDKTLECMYVDQLYMMIHTLETQDR